MNGKETRRSGAVMREEGGKGRRLEAEGGEGGAKHLRPSSCDPRYVRLTYYNSLPHLKC